MTRRLLIGRAGSPGASVGRLLWVEAIGPGHASEADGSSLGAAAEADRLRAAMIAAAEELDTLARETAGRAGEDIGAIFEAQALFARDPGILDPALAAVADGASAVEAPPTCATSAGGSPTCSPAERGPTSTGATARPPSSPPRTSIRRSSPRSGPSWSAGSPWSAERRAATLRSSPAPSESRSSWGSGVR
jgi:hypothetical protein